MMKKTGVVIGSKSDAAIGSKYNDPNLPHVYKLSTAYVVETSRQLGNLLQEYYLNVRAV